MRYLRYSKETYQWGTLITFLSFLFRKVITKIFSVPSIADGVISFEN